MTAQAPWLKGASLSVQGVHVVLGKNRTKAFSLIQLGAQSKMKKDTIELIGRKFGLQRSAVEAWYDWRLAKKRK